MCSTQVGSAIYLGERLDRPVGLKVSKSLGPGLGIRKCRQCGLIFPADSITFNENIFAKRQNGNFLPYSQIPHKGSFEKELDLIEGFFFDHCKELDALDAGFGNSLLPMMKRFRSVKGIEAFQEIFQNATLHPELSSVKSDLINTDLDNANYPEASFDFIFLEAFQHFRNLIMIKKSNEMATTKWFDLYGSSFFLLVNSKNGEFDLLFARDKLCL